MKKKHFKEKGIEEKSFDESLASADFYSKLFMKSPQAFNKVLEYEEKWKI